MSLSKKAEYPATDKVENTLKGLHQLIANLMLSAGKGYRKLHTGHCEFKLVTKQWLDICYAYIVNSSISRWTEASAML